MIEQKYAPFNYQKAGVDLDGGHRLVAAIKKMAGKTHTPHVLSGIGGFSALFELPLERFKQAVLVSSTDGVGTKLKLAIESRRPQGIGIDLVAMCVNDIIVCGAEPLFFLDYYATGRLCVEEATRVMESITLGCMQAGVALIGGETAEMPGMYASEDYDLAGFVVGIVEKQAIIDGKTVASGDVLLGLESTGPHANGYSLIRKIIDTQKIDLYTTELQGIPLIDHLLMPTAIYVKPIQELLRACSIKAMAHITGGGILENLPRVLPDNTCAVIEETTYPPIFQWIQERGEISKEDMYRTFNCGIGMVLCLDKSEVPRATKVLAASGIKSWEIGYITHAEGSAKVRML